MSLDLVYERLALKRVTSENSSETVVEGTVTLPDRAREIGRALALRATPRPVKVDVKDGRVVFEGSFDLTLLYAHETERSLEPSSRDGYDDADDDYGYAESAAEERLESISWRDELPFAYVLELPGVTEGEEVETAVKVASTSFDVRSDRVTLDVDIAVSFSARRAEYTQLVAAKGIRGAQGIEVERRTVRVATHLGEAHGAAEARGRLSLSGRTAPERVLEVRAVPVVAEASAGDGVVRVQGYLNYGILYAAAGGSRAQCGEWSRGAAFQLEIEAPSAVRGASCDVAVRPKATDCRVVEDEDGTRWLEVKTPLEVDVKLGETKEVAIVTGINAGEREIACRRETLRLFEVVGEAQKTEEASGSLDLPEGLPAIERLLLGAASADVDDVHVLGDKVAVDLHVDAELLYAARGPVEGAVHAARWPRALELDLEIPVRGAEPGLERRVAVEVLDASFELINRESVEARVLLAVEVAVSREVELDVVAEAVEVPPVEANPPTYTYVVVQPQDTIWKLAARYHSHPEIIVAANGWLESEDSPLVPGKKVCVPRKTAKAG